MGDGIAGAVTAILTHDTFEILISHTRRDNQNEYGKIERITIGKIDDPSNPQYSDPTAVDLEQALKGKFVSCNVQYRDIKTDALVCNVFVQKPPEGF